MRFCKIVVLIDYSEASLQAAEEAALIASKFDSELQLMHISSKKQSQNLITPGIPFFDTPETHEEEYYAKIEQLEKVKANLAKRHKVVVTCFENKGDFIDVLKQHMKHFSVDLIVLGARKRNWLKQLLFADKARSVIRNVDCEVLCVHSESKTATLKKIVLTVGKSVPKKKIRIAYEFAKKFTARIYLVALNTPEKKSHDQSTETLIASYRYLKDISNIPIECRTVAGKSIAETALHYAKVVGADLILIDKGSESDLQSSWSGNIVNHSPIPVLSVQPDRAGAKNKYRGIAK
jgi:nucleotide-binding universal stress UspA family protein